VRRFPRVWIGALDRAADLVCPRACFRCRQPRSDDDALCPACLGAIAAPDLPRLPGLDAAAAGGAYAGEVEAWVLAFKIGRGLALPDPGPEAMLGALLARAAGGVPGPPPDLVVPVPLHPRRLRRRGFNPAGVLARRLARHAGADFDPVALARTRDTPPQKGLDARARRRNVAGAFASRRGRPVPARVWLVDDVVTTGATLASAARALRAGGAQTVVGLCAAATPRIADGPRPVA
jgi:ComF family protein